jgi:hypothetical protein
MKIDALTITAITFMIAFVFVWRPAPEAPPPVPQARVEQPRPPRPVPVAEPRPVAEPSRRGPPPGTISLGSPEAWEHLPRRRLPNWGCERDVDNNGNLIPDDPRWPDDRRTLKDTPLFITYIIEVDLWILPPLRHIRL